MKKITVSILLAVLALGLFTGIASAQATETQVGTMHDYMVTALADALNLTVADVDARLTAGETMYDIALAEGIAEADMQTFLTNVHTKAINAAIADGTITQAQADRMIARGLRGTGMMGAGYGTGSRMGAGDGACTGTDTRTRMGTGMHGGGRWQQVNP
jgi:hypothetical protein